MVRQLAGERKLLCDYLDALFHTLPKETLLLKEHGRLQVRSMLARPLARTHARTPREVLGAAIGVRAVAVGDGVVELLFSPSAVPPTDPGSHPLGGAVRRV